MNFEPDTVATSDRTRIAHANTIVRLFVLLLLSIGFVDAESIAQDTSRVATPELELTASLAVSKIFSVGELPSFRLVITNLSPWAATISKTHIGNVRARVHNADGSEVPNGEVIALIHQPANARWDDVRQNKTTDIPALHSVSFTYDNVSVDYGHGKQITTVLSGGVLDTETLKNELASGVPQGIKFSHIVASTDSTTAQDTIKTHYLLGPGEFDVYFDYYFKSTKAQRPGQISLSTENPVRITIQ